MKRADINVVEAIFLLNNPGWTWRDLQETPAPVIEIMDGVRKARAQVAEGRANRTEF